MPRRPSSGVMLEVTVEFTCCVVVSAMSTSHHEPGPVRVGGGLLCHKESRGRSHRLGVEVSWLTRESCVPRLRCD